MFFDSWGDLLRVAVIAVLAYGGLILVLRVSGKRTLAKWNAFDLVVTVALGSTLATLLLTSRVSYIEGMLSLAMLVGLQFVIAWLSVHSNLFRRLIKAEPTLLYRSGKFLDQALDRERVTHSEVRAAVRGAGLGSMEDVEAVVLETDGSVSVIKKTSASASALEDVV